jgi:hypothetical protein
MKLQLQEGQKGERSRQEENILPEHYHPKPDSGRVEGVVAANGSKE